MTTVNERILDAQTGHAIDLTRYGTGVLHRLIGILNRTDADLFAQLTAALETMDPQSFTVERLEGLLYSVRSLNAAAYAQIERELTTELRAFVEQEAHFQLDLFRSAIPAQVQVHVGISPLNIEQVFTAAYSQPFNGRLLREWAQGLEAGRMARIRDAVRIGYVENQTTSQIIRRIRGTKAKGYADGLVEPDRRHIETITRSAISHMAGVTRDRFLAANQDVVSCVTWTATLDQLTSNMCRVRDGLRYTAAEHKPIGHKVPWLAGPGRLHFNAIPAGTMIRKSTGCVPVESLSVGDLVVTHRGRLRPVLELKTKCVDDGIVRAVHMKSGRVFKATDDHPVLTTLGWKFVGALEVGDKLFGDAEHAVIEAHGRGAINAGANHNPAGFDNALIALKRAAKLVATNVDFECEPDVWAREVENCSISLVLRYPALIKRDEGIKHHLLALAQALQKLGRYGFGNLLANLYRNGPAGTADAHPSIVAVGDVGCADALGDTRHVDGVVLQHPGRMSGVSGAGFLGEAPGPVLDSGGVLEAAGPDALNDLVPLAAHGNAMPSGETGEGAVSKALGSFDVSQGSAALDVFALNDVAVVGVLFGHDEVVALEVQNYIGQLHDLEVADDSSYVANGIAISNCRSCSSPVTKSWKELGIDADELDAGSRASMDGAVPAELSYQQWLSKQSAGRQDYVLGPVRGKLLREGGLTIDKFTTEKGEWLTLDQLKAKNAEAFKRAGIGA